MASSQQQNLGRDMLAAAARGDAEGLKGLIAAGAPLDPVDAHKQTPLLVAVQNNHLSAAIALIEAGSNINAQAANMDSPWLLAGARGRTEMLRRMISKGPDFSLRNRYGGTALIPACHYGHVDTVKLLLTTGINVNHVNDLGWTCLLEIVHPGRRRSRSRRDRQAGTGAQAPIRTSPTRTVCRRSPMHAARAKPKWRGDSRGRWQVAYGDASSSLAAGTAACGWRLSGHGS